VQIDDYQLAEQLLFSHLLCCAFYPKQSVIQYYRYYFIHFYVTFYAWQREANSKNSKIVL